MGLNLQDFPTLVKTQAAAVTLACDRLVDMTVGSVTRALLEANASIALWMQWLIVQVLAATRAVTSTGADLDSWVADFGMVRLPATTAAGSVTFSRVTPGIAASIPVGALVRTGLGSSDQVYSVVADTFNPAWNGLGYTLAALDSAITVTVAAQVAGAAGNVVPNAVSLLASAIPGVDSVSNAQAMVGGVDAETDAALRLRFSGYLDSRNRATSQAVGFAIASIRQGMTYTIAERVDASGATRPGHFTVTVDDGTGSPSADLIAQVSGAVDLVRPIGGTFSVRPPLVSPVSIEIHATGPATALAAAQVAVTTYVAALPIGAALTITRLYQVVYGADPAISNAFGATVNGSGADIVPPVFGLLRPSTVAVTT